MKEEADTADSGSTEAEPAVNQAGGWMLYSVVLHCQHIAGNSSLYTEFCVIGGH